MKKVDLFTNAFRDGHYEVVAGIHVSFALICAAYFRMGEQFREDCKYLLESIDSDILSQINALVAAGPCSTTIALELVGHLESDQPLISGEKRKVSCPTPPRRNEPEEVLLWRPGFGLESTDRVLIVYDNAITMGNIRKIIKLVKGTEASVEAIAVLIERRKTQEFIDGIPLFAVYDLSEQGLTVDLDRESCPLCDKGVKLDTNLRVI